MSSEVTEETVISAMEELRKNDTMSVQNAGEYLLKVMDNPSNLMLFFSIINKPYPDSVS